MEHATIIGIDLAKRSFQLHGARADGSVAFRKKLNRDKVLHFVASHPPCVVAMEACASAHHWGREIGKLGHEVKLVPPIYVKPFVKRQKNDAADAEAICEAASRPTMRFVAVKTREQQSQGMLFRTRDLLVRQRTQTINALRGHFAEFGVVASQGPAHVDRLADAIEDADSGLPGPVRDLGALLFVQLSELDEKIAELEQELRERAREDEQTVRLMSIPGIGPLSAMAIQAFAPPMESFRRGRDFAAWLGLVPRQSSTGGKPKLGKISTSMSGSKPAIYGRLKTGHFRRPETGVEIYFTASSVGKVFAGALAVTPEASGQLDSPSSTDRSRSQTCSGNSAVAEPASDSGNASRHSRYCSCNSRSVCTASFHCCGRDSGPLADGTGSGIRRPCAAPDNVPAVPRSSTPHDHPAPLRNGARRRRSAERSRRKRGDRPTARLSSASVYACALVRDSVREVMLRAEGGPCLVWSPG